VFGVWGVGFGVWCLVFGVWDSVFGVWGLGLRIWGFVFGDLGGENQVIDVVLKQGLNVPRAYLQYIIE
jgi:hypothetical protein